MIRRPLPALLAPAAVLCLASAASACPQATAEQDLYLAGRLGRVWHVEDYDTTNPTATLLPGGYVDPSLAFSQCGATTFTGFVFDPATSIYFLISTHGTLSGSCPPQSSYLIRGHLTHQFPAEIVHEFVDTRCAGLELRSDGWMVTICDRERLFWIDPDGGEGISTLLDEPLMTPLGFEHLAIDPRGEVVLSAWDEGEFRRVDPQTGTSVGLDLIPHLSAAMIEIDRDGTVLHGSIGRALRTSDPDSGAILTNSTIPSIGYSYSLHLTLPADDLEATIACDAEVNETGQRATIEAIGTAAVADNDLTLYSRRLPPTFGYFLVGETVAQTPVSFGTLCIGAPQYRYSGSVLSSGPEGQVRFAIDLASVPGTGQVQPGDERVFQFWFRDNHGAGTNFSPAMQVTFR